MGKPALLAFVIALALGSTRCETSVSDAPVSFGVPEITATPFDLNHRQSETAIVSSSAGFFPFVVVAYNDGSVAFNNPTADYSTQTYHRGWSQLGWSTSATSGVTWDYRGQVPPMLANAFSTNGGWSALIGDPAAAVDRKSTNHVYISNLGVSDATWNAVSAGTDTIVFGSAGLQYLGHTVRSPIDLADSLCVAQSNDGGISFSALGCLVLGSAAQVDRTALAVDGKGFVWVATISVPAANLANFGHFRLFRSTAPASVSAFVEVGLPVANVYDPVLKNDAEGNIWLGGQGVGAVGANDGSVWIQEFDTTKNVWRVSRDVAKLCGKTVDRDVNPFFGNFSTLRNAHPYDFDIGLDETVLISLQNGASASVFEELSPVTSVQGCAQPRCTCTLVHSDDECFVQQFAPSAANKHSASTMTAAWHDTRLSPHTWGDLATQTSGGFGTSAPPTSGYPNVLILDAPQGRHSGAPGIFGSWIADEQLASGVNVPYAQLGVLGNTPWGDYEGMAVDTHQFFLPGMGR